jgi:hypothetical protein
MTEGLDKCVWGCPAPRNLGKFARFIWAHETWDSGWPLEELVKLQKALECWDDYRLARKDGLLSGMEKKAQEFKSLWEWTWSHVPLKEKIASMLGHPDSLEEHLIAAGEPDMCDFYGVED